MEDANKIEEEKVETTEENNQATSYEPYTGGQPSPSPDYPQEINNLSGDVEYKVRGKNLFNDTFELGGINNTTGINSTGTTSIRNVNYIDVEQNTTYTIVSNAKDTNSRIALRFYDKNETFLSAGDTRPSPNTFTTPSNCHKLRIVITNETSLSTLVMLNEGSTATTYEPYISESFPLSLGDIELCAISDYKDRIYSQNGEFYLEKKTGKVVLDGSRNWTKSGNTNIDRFVLSGYVDYGDTNCFSNYFTNETYSDSNYNKSKIFLNTYSNTKRLIINFNTVGTTSLSDFKNWLSTHNTTVYYVLATPTTTEITEENYPTLYSQLLAIQEFLTKYKINKEFLLDYSSPEIEY